MTDAPVSENVMTLDEFVRLYDREGPFEILDGQRIVMSPTIMGHNIIVMRLVVPMQNYAQENKLGECFTESPFVLTYDSDWVKGSRVPDIMFITAERLKTYHDSDPDWQSKPLVLVPDLVVEIVSPTDSYLDVDKKVHTYLADGVKLVWVINPRLQTVTAHVAGSNQHTTLSRQDTLTGGDVIPGFSIVVQGLFE